MKQKLNCALPFQISRAPIAFAFEVLKQHIHGLRRDPPEGADLAVDLCRHTLRRAQRLGHFLLRKEVIQPQVPLRLPCYDFIPVTTHTLGHCLLAVGACTSGTSNFHDVTGGVYKARERIHGVVADTPLLAIPASRRRVAACDPN